MEKTLPFSSHAMGKTWRGLSTLLLIKIMRLAMIQVTVAIIFSGLAVAHDNHAQTVLDRPVSIQLKDVTLEIALAEIGLKTKVRFGYSSSHVNVNVKVSIEASDEKLSDVLGKLLEPHLIHYFVQESAEYIILTNGSQEQAQSDNQQSSKVAIPITGTIKDKSGNPMPGVNIAVKGTTNGLTTDNDGKYTIEVNEGDVLVFSFIGFKTVEVTVGNQSVIDISLEEDVTTLEGVTIYSTGYDNVSAERTTGSFSQLDEKLLERNVGTDLLSRLNGVTPSLLIDQRNGTKAFFNIRGTSTIMANDQPLIVVDNFPYNGDLNTINPNDIETITVLRDAAAASIWGVRAGNGVIVITTKSAKANSPQRISINTNVTIGEPTDLYYRPAIATSDFIDVEHNLFDQGYYDGILSDNIRNPKVSPVVEILNRERNGEITEQQANAQLDALRSNDSRRDLKKYFYQRNINQQYAINFSGSTAKHSYFASAGYDNNRSTLIGDRNDRLTLNLQNMFKITSRLSIDTRLVYTKSSAALRSNQADFSSQLYRYTKLTDDKGNPIPITYDYRTDFVENAPSKGFLDWAYNPINELGRIQRVTDQDNLRTAVGLSYQIVEGLNADFRYQYENESIENLINYSESSYFARDLINQYSSFNGTSVTKRNIPFGAIRNEFRDKMVSQNGRFQLNFNRSFGELHQINSLAGIEIREVIRNGYSSRQYGYDKKQGTFGIVDYVNAFPLYPGGGNALIPNLASLSGTLDRFRSYFSNVAYTFNGKYTLSASGRIDQSNLFGVRANQRSAPLWSVGGKWIAKDDLLADMDFISMFNVRATYGYNGNIDQYTTAYATALLTATAFSQTPTARLVSPPNPDLTWERTRMLNLALDFGVIKNRISAKFEHYRKTGIDLIGVAPLDPTLGFPDFRGNVASMRGYGWDTELNTINTTGPIRWETNIFLSHVSDKITEYHLDQPQISYILTDPSINRDSETYTPLVGKPLFGIYSFRSAGLDPNTGDPRGYVNGQPSNDYTAIFSNYTIDSLKYHGRATPSVFGGFRNTVSYKGFSLSINLVYRFGYYFRNTSISYNNLYLNSIGHSDYALRWREPGDEKKTHVPSEIYPANQNRDYFYNSSSVLVDKADNIRLQDIRLAYDVRSLKLRRTSFSQIQLYVYMNNIGILWKASNSKVDPDFPSMRPLRSISLGTKISF